MHNINKANTKKKSNNVVDETIQKQHDYLAKRISQKIINFEHFQLYGATIFTSISIMHGTRRKIIIEHRFDVKIFLFGKTIFEKLVEVV